MSEGGADSVADLEAEAAAVAEEEVSVAAEEEAVEADLAEGTNKEDEEEDHLNKDSHTVLPASMDLRSLMIKWGSCLGVTKGMTTSHQTNTQHATTYASPRKQRSSFSIIVNLRS